MSKEAMKLARAALARMKAYGNTFGYRSNEQNPYEQVCEAIAAIDALAERPAQQEPVGWQDTLYLLRRLLSNQHTFTGPEFRHELTKIVGEACRATPQPAQRTWVPVTKQLLNEQHPWLYQPMWIAMKDGTVIQGYYEWRQGRNPDRFRTGMRDEWAFDAAYVMPIVKPIHPDKEKP